MRSTALTVPMRRLKAKPLDPEMRLDFVYFEKRNRYLAAVCDLFRRLVFRLLEKRKVVAVAFFLQLSTGTKRNAAEFTQ